MGTTASSATIAVMVFLSGTFAILGYTLLWALTSHRPSRARAHMTGRSAAPYWYSTTGLQDERGIIATPTR